MLEHAGKTLRISSMRERVSPAEWQARIDCAACYRLVAHFDMADMMANHISVRVPGEDGAFLINPYGMMYEEMTASSLIKVDLDGTILDKPDYGDFDFGINRAGYVIHSAIHGAKHEIDCVIHTHTWPGMAVSSLECGLLPMTQTAMRFTRISYHEYHGVVLDLRNHGLLTVGRSVGEAFNALHRLELSCRAQIAAMSCNTPLHPVPQAVLEATYQNYQPNVRRPYGLMEWPGLLRMLDRIDPSYAS
jgi:ribulose-5-phosphate 4-epimerase/fuculose-1-phosphate aldolase